MWQILKSKQGKVKSEKLIQLSSLFALRNLFWIALLCIDHCNSILYFNSPPQQFEARGIFILFWRESTGR